MRFLKNSCPLWLLHCFIFSWVHGFLTSSQTVVQQCKHLSVFVVRVRYRSLSYISTPKRVLCTYKNVNICVTYKPAIVTSLSKSSRHKKPVLHAAFRAFYLIYWFTDGSGGWCGGGCMEEVLNTQVHVQSCWENAVLQSLPSAVSVRSQSASSICASLACASKACVLIVWGMMVLFFQGLSTKRFSAT